MWFCPTFQRPERLAELALSWDRCEKGKKLHVRVWRGDPKLNQYFAYEWPEGWELSVTDHEWTAEALNGFYDWNPNQDFYGFIADDIVLRTPGGLKIVEDAAKPWFMAYPNDGHWRHFMPTHFCMGGELLRTLGYWVPRVLKHNGIDMAMLNVARNCGLLRYCPQVVFQHKHFLIDPRVKKDETYSRVYTESWIDKGTDLERWTDPSTAESDAWLDTYCAKEVEKVRRALVAAYEDREEWEFEDAQMKEMGLEVESGPVHSCAE